MPVIIIQLQSNLQLQRILLASGQLVLDINFVTGNIANYLRLQEVDSMYLPVPVNFIFIGFEGKGNEGAYLLILRFDCMIL